MNCVSRGAARRPLTVAEADQALARHPNGRATLLPGLSVAAAHRRPSRDHSIRGHPSHHSGGWPVWAWAGDGERRRAVGRHGRHWSRDHFACADRHRYSRENVSNRVEDEKDHSESASLAWNCAEAHVGRLGRASAERQMAPVLGDLDHS